MAIALAPASRHRAELPITANGWAAIEDALIEAARG